MPSHASAVSRAVDVTELAGIDAGLQHRLDPVLVLAPAHAELLGAFGGERRELVEEDPHVIGIAVDDVEQLVAQHGQLRRRRPASRGNPIRAEHHFVHHPIVDRGEELLLRPDVVVEGALAQTVDRAQLDDARGVVAASREDLCRSVDDRFAARRPLRAASGFVALCGSRHRLRPYIGTARKGRVTREHAQLRGARRGRHGCGTRHRPSPCPPARRPGRPRRRQRPRRHDGGRRRRPRTGVGGRGRDRRRGRRCDRRRQRRRRARPAPRRSSTRRSSSSAASTS